ncbi:MAG TPA: NAD-dependent epimerase/dehydratase family protein [Acidimicrobiales bacterium]|nr:NAD-dependent epimerase/dehydratase family protein [Acidimicrobiales bacterium]
MDVLLLGGPLFLGRHVIDALQTAGHRVTVFNRGKTNPDDYPDVERLVGDRRDDVSALDGRRWDAAIDTSAYFPGDVRRSMEALAGAVGHYTFVSTISVYADASSPGMDETATVGTIDDPEMEEITGESYGPLKALCEQAAEAAMPGKVANVRPGLIVGPHDPSDRFTYWVRRLASGGDVLAPDRPDMPVQVIDGRDLADWIVRLAETGTTGVFNATGPATPHRFDATLDACRGAAGVDASITWVDEAWLIDQKVEPWMELPLWLPGGEGYDGLSAVDVSRAVDAGLTFRPLVDTCAATLEWDRTRDGAGMDAQLSPEREAELLAAWRSR